jgi:hypothetical protein
VTELKFAQSSLIPSHEPSWLRSASKISHNCVVNSGGTAGGSIRALKNRLADCDHRRGTTRCLKLRSTGDCTSDCRIGLGRSRSRREF